MSEPTLDDELRAALDACPLSVRVCEGGGPENLAASIAVTMAKLAERVAKLETERDSYLKHANEGWALCNQRTAERTAARNLVRWCWKYTPYPQCGRDQMDATRRMLFDEIIEETSHYDDEPLINRL